MTTLYLDTETFNETPIQVGTHRYCETVEVMIVSWAVDDGPVQVYDRTRFGHNIPASGPLLPPEVQPLIDDPDVTIVFHNSGFDRPVLRANGCRIDPARIHDTQVQARAHGLPGGLDKLCAIFQVPTDLAKHKSGKALIQLFCKPGPKNRKLRRATGITHPAEWQTFLDYAGGDIEAMRYLYKNMPSWNYPNREHDLWVLDQKINDRGFKVDLDLARGAIETVKLVAAEKDAETAEMTDGQLKSTRQRDQLLKLLLEEYGVKLPDMTGNTIERRLEDPDLPEEVKELLANRLMVSSSSTSKYNKIVKGVSSDGRMRGTLEFCGAARTKRWSGKLFQPQNLPRPDMEQADIDFAVRAISAGVGRELLDDPMRASWNALRGLIVATEGRKLVQADLSGIEARVLPWLAGEEWKLKAFWDYDTITGVDMLGDPVRKGPDMYRATAAKLLKKAVRDITGKERQSHGKVVELACGYGGAAGAFAQFAALYRVDMPRHEVDAAIRGWREAHPAIADWDDGLWALLDRAARGAIQNKGKLFYAGKHIAFERWRNWLKMHLPSGGYLSYANPAIIEDPRRPGNDTVSFMGINNYTRRWERITTYGGKLSADATQSTAREILAFNMPHIEASGYPIVLTVHDEVITEPLDTDNHSVDDLVARITRRPPWIDDALPLAAGGFEAYRYRKD
jgi:DNA polymerase